MFAALTETELGMLRSKLYSAGSKFAAAGHGLGTEAMRLPILSAEHETAWARRAPLVDAMTEMYGLAESTELAAR